MFPQRIAQQVSRLATSKTVSVQTRRTLYPHYIRYMSANIPGAKQASFANKVIVYLGFVGGIMGIPTLIMYDVGRKRPKA